MYILISDPCQPVSMSESETVGLIDIYSEVYGKCVNNKPIQGFVECGGLCNSKTAFNRATGQQDQKCECCSVSEYEKMQVSVVCDDGSEQIAVVSVPKSCSCKGCGGGFSNENRNEFRGRDVEHIEDSEDAENKRKINALGWLINLDNLVNNRNIRVRI